MFPTYISKGGFHVVGERPMFEDSDEENLGRDIKAKLLEVFGHYPILDVNENYTLERDFMGEELENPIELRDYHALFDTERLDQISYGLSYVQFLLEKVIKHKIDNPKARDMSTYASKKYCFSDTEDWWTAMLVEGDTLPDGRERFEVVVELG